MTLKSLLPLTVAILASSGALAPSAVLAGDSSRRPNVVFILADDLGWSDTTLFGTTDYYQTPNVERLAARGMTFSRSYSASPLCSPTRASILTGLSPARLGLTAPNCHLPQVILQAQETTTGPPQSKATVPTAVTRLKTDYYTLAEALRDNGYATGHFGKWHLGSEPYSPLEHGFDVDVPHWHGPGPAGSYVAPWKYPDFDPNTPQEHIEDRMAEEAVAFMEQHRDEPFFLNYWMFSVHAPFDAKQELIEKYKKTANPDNPQRSPTYAAMIESMDDAVGTLLNALDRLGLAENTIIVFLSDNGGNMYNTIDNTTPTSNAPLRGGKATMYEGGIRGPGIVVYPGKIQPESKSDEVIQSTDFYPTLLELLEIAPQPGQQFDGLSIAAALQGESGESLVREAIFTYFPHDPKVPEWLPPSVSVHAGDWKLIRLFHAGEQGEHRWKLFDLKADIGEENNLAREYPDKVKELDDMIEEFLTEANAARPLPNSRFNPELYDMCQEGVSQMNKPRPKSQLGQKVAGWQPSGDCRLKLRGTKLLVQSDGNDPYLSHRLPKHVPAGRYTLNISMQGNSAGDGQIFWQEKGAKPPYFRGRSASFQVLHDGVSHDYKVPFVAKQPIIGLRIDPSRGPGELEIGEISLLDENAKEVFQWKIEPSNN